MKMNCPAASIPLFSFLFLLLIFIFLPYTSCAGDWKEAASNRIWSFPGDHGSHREYRTEWWYFTGNLTDEAGNRYGYQLTFFRQGLDNSEASRSNPRKNNPWLVRDVYFAHFTLTDVKNNLFQYFERISRTGPGLAHADTKRMDVGVLNWSAKMKTIYPESRSFPKEVIYLRARHQGMEINLELNPGKPVVLHGQNGLSRKGPKKGQSSYYYSFVDLKTKGSIKTGPKKESVDVRGVSWFDHEFGSNQLSSEQIGWDWFGIHLSDGRDLMVYFLRKKDGNIEATSSGTLIEKNGLTRHLSLSDVTVNILEKWKSPKTGSIYPGKWHIRIPSAQIDLTLSPQIANQELTTKAPVGITYWEGAIQGKGISEKKPVTVEGYVELTGYGGSLGGVF
jgi:predicted secreted hydrolase